MEDVHRYTDKDAVVAAVLMKTTELVRAWGADAVKVSMKGQGDSADPHIYIHNSDGRVIEVFVGDKLSDGRQFIDCQTYSIGGSDYEQWAAASPEEFYAALDEDIVGMAAVVVDDRAVGPSCGR